ncbi:MAG: transcriptional repressor LexA, partial [Nitrospirae bacterium]|nr:transcriptional repressor LexA [Nitrospirota bacterium]
RVELRPANPRLSAMMVDEGDLQVQGIVVGLIRKFHR